MESPLQYKYGIEINKLDNCPPADTQERNGEGYRFVFDEIGDERNFLPVLVLNPKRQITQTQECSGYALSFFDTLENARRKYESLLRSHRNIGKTLGTYIASGWISNADGFVSPTNAGGHFNLFEFSGCDLSATFQIVDKC